MTRAYIIFTLFALGAIVSGTHVTDSGRGRAWGYDDGGRYALVAVSGYSIAGAEDRRLGEYGVVFSIIDCETGDEVEISPVLNPRGVEVRDERRRLIGRVRHLNGKQEAFV